MKSLILVFLAISASQVRGHGMLLEPPNRSSMWRFGYDVPANYDDNQLYCGAKHQDESISTCGICGDPISQPQPRDNENGGKYGLGIITRTYQPGAVIPILVKLSANHYGKFQFSICNLDNVRGPESEGCFVVVPREDGSLYYDVPKIGPGNFTYNLRLPSGLACRHCTLRWTYRGANTWGNCADGSSGLGCGPQETFRGCADVTIGSPYDWPAATRTMDVEQQVDLLETRLNVDVERLVANFREILKDIQEVKSDLILFQNSLKSRKDIK